MTRRPLPAARTLPVVALFLTLGLVPSTRARGVAQEPKVDYGTVSDLRSPDRKVRRQAAKALLREPSPALIPVVVDVLPYMPAEARDEALRVLAKLTGEERGTRYFDWVELVGSRQDLRLPAGYREWKRGLLGLIDPRFRSLLPDEAVVRLRLEEIVWGGVKVEGIPALESPAKVSANEAGFLDPDDRVFGVSLAGRHHAYPVKVLGWHEMVNDTLGGRPFSLSYCTLCGSGVLYDTRRDDGEPLTFGTSGLLYRSNKLMVDRQTGSLWHNLTGEAVVGPAAERSEVLDMLPVTLTRWKHWRAAHPDTTVAEPDPQLGASFGYDYTEGAADARREGVSFPVWQKSDRFDDKTEVLALRVDGRAKAYELEALARAGLVNDRLGDVALLALVAADGGARAYRRGEQTFAPGGDGELVDGDGRVWRIDDHTLVPPSGSGLEPLERVPSHVAFWFGWYGFHPDTEIFPETEAPTGERRTRSDGG